MKRWLWTWAFSKDWVLQAGAPPQPEFNRAVEKRLDSNWLSEVFETSALVRTTCFLWTLSMLLVWSSSGIMFLQIIPLLGTKNLVKCEEPVFLSSASFSTRKFTEMGCHSKPIFLGLAQDTNQPIFAVDISTISRYNVTKWILLWEPVRIDFMHRDEKCTFCPCEQYRFKCIARARRNWMGRSSSVWITITHCWCWPFGVCQGDGGMAQEKC